ncbi:MAG: SAF domain-containing protein, partial [Mycobacteriaceae bacterium]
MANHTSNRRRAPARPKRAGLAPLWRERLAQFTRPGWARTMHIRRAVAALLVVLAGVLAVRGGPESTGSAVVVVVAHDLSPGHILTDEDLRIVHREPVAVPSGAVTVSADATGRSLATAVRGGETLTDVRLVG